VESGLKPQVRGDLFRAGHALFCGKDTKDDSVVPYAVYTRLGARVCCVIS